MTLSPRSSSRALFSWTLLILFCLVITDAARSQSQSEAANKRRVVERTEPLYPKIARELRLEGVVRLEAVVSADGSVKTVNVKGGHPVLADAAANAVKRWKWERAPQESHELLEVKFSRPE